MHIRVRAPLLSAAFSIVRIWIMIQTCFRTILVATRSAPGGLLHNLEQTPRLVPRHRPARGDDHYIALFGGAALVVRQQLGRAADLLAVSRMRAQPLDLDGDGLLHLVAHHAPGEGACAFGFCGHFLVPPALAPCFSRSTVLRRAILRRTLPN